MSKTGLDLANNFEDSVDSLNQSLLELSQEGDGKFGTKIDVLLEAKLAMIPFLTAQLQTEGDIKTPDRSKQINNLINLMNNIESSLYRKKEMEAREEVDLSHPKIQKALEWVIEATTIALNDIGVENSQVANYIHKLAQRMVGFEEEANKRLKGVAFQKLDTVENPIPLIDIFNKVRHGEHADVIDAE